MIINVITKYKTAITGTNTSSTLTVAFFLSTITAAKITSAIVVQSGGMLKALLNDSETELLTRYIEIAPKDAFKDILDAIDHFIYFENRRK